MPQGLTLELCSLGALLPYHLPPFCTELPLPRKCWPHQTPVNPASFHSRSPNGPSLGGAGIENQNQGLAHARPVLYS